ncbi:DUF4388 domain-containing protein [Hyalangium rubrum]|uniref:DUF4388 domain-containing protein n=1 Tax=Hyalangium rubrum TaxID=3103134 RepID=A0ABU5HC97_9BACT|nr:DUF4388 domain-containing protein [Hyalangium sp. s54d21]MDY7231080.1 DUF4388 domain-containing protein [Hyalangium sp. s54d21]
MEHFKGSLSHYAMEVVVPVLLSRRAEGTLRVERGPVVRYFFFRGGFLVGEGSNTPSEHLGQVLVDLGILDAPRAALAFEAAEVAKVPYGAFLVHQQFVELPRMVEALEYKAREAFFDCYNWDSGEVEFTLQLPSLEQAVALKMPLSGLHRDALARRREWKVFRDVFPGVDATFRVFREHAGGRFSEEESVLMKRADAGATLAELLASGKEPRIFVARRLMHLYRRGALSPQRTRGPTVGEATQVADLMEAARRFMQEGRYDHALAVTEQVLERGPLPEAHALYRAAEVALTLAVCDELFSLDGRLLFEPLPRPLPVSLTADDLYLYSKLRGSASIRQALRTAAMGEAAASRSVHRLLATGLIRIAPSLGELEPQRKTDPYGFIPSGSAEAPAWRRQV